MTSNANLQKWPRAYRRYRPPAMPECYVQPLYVERYADWHRYHLAYKGGERAISAFLLPHERERADSYDARLERAVYPNHINVVVETYASHLFRQAPSRAGGSDVLMTFWEDTDNDAATADTLFHSVARLVQVHGGIGVLVDRRDPDGADTQPKTRAEEQAVGRRPYAKIVRPADVVDWSYGPDGALDWVMLRESTRPTRDFNQPYSDPIDRFRRWTRTGWELYRVEAVDESSAGDGGARYRYTLEAEGAHPVGYVPFHAVHWGERVDGAWFGESAIGEFVPMVARLINLLSLSDEQLYQVVFPILQVPFAVWEELEKVEFAVTGAIPRPDEGNGCEWLSPPVEPVQVLQEQVTATEQSIRYLSGIGRQNEQSRAAQSGLALAYQNADKRAMIEQFARRMERLELQVAETAELWMGLTPSDDLQITYRVEVTAEEIEGALRDALQFESLGIGGEAALENHRQAIKAHLGRYVGAERMAEIMADLTVPAPADFQPFRTPSF